MRRITKKGMSTMKILIQAALIACAIISMPAIAAEREEPKAMSMAADLVIARPLGIVITAVGTAAFVVSLPFSALGGNVAGAADALVVKPGKETFVRCLGCKTSGRAR
jgi:hypothetical protein